MSFGAPGTVVRTRRLDCYIGTDTVITLDASPRERSKRYQKVFISVILGRELRRIEDPSQELDVKKALNNLGWISEDDEEGLKTALERLQSMKENG